MDMKIGDLKVWHIPQVPMKAFEVAVSSVEEGVKIMRLLADYDTFQFDNNIKPDYSNAQGLMRWEKCGHEDGYPPIAEWTDWYDEETGIDDPEEYLQRLADEKEEG